MLKNSIVIAFIVDVNEIHTYCSVSTVSNEIKLILVTIPMLHIVRTTC